MTREDINVTLRTLRITFIILLAVMVAAIAGLLVFWSNEANAGVGSSFNLNCAYDHSLNDDPIVYPGISGYSHLHDFFGNKTTSGNSTYTSLSGQATSCQNTHDRAAYWAPAAYVNGARVLPKNIKAYYYHRINGAIEPFPQGLKMLAGYATTTGPEPTSVVYFGCGSGTGISKVSYAPNCTKGNLQIHLIFGDCGANNPDGSPMLDYSDHRGHLAYSTKGVCASSYPRHYPQLVMRLNYDIKDARTLQFACRTDGNPQCVEDSPGSLFGRAPYYTVHGDFINAWDPAELSRLVGTI